MQSDDGLGFFQVLFRIASVAVWVLCALAILVIILQFVLAMGGAKSAPQEASAAAACCFEAIAAYILARCIEKAIELGK